METQAKRWPILTAAEEVFINSPRIFEEAINPILGSTRFYYPLLYLTVSIVAVALIVTCIAPEIVGYIFWKSFSIKGNKRIQRKEYGLIEG
jgi:hypothetical protein